MIVSMTGFGRSQRSIQGINVQVEIKTLNSRYREFNIKLPQEANYLEPAIINSLKGPLQRGKININIGIDVDTVSSSGALYNEQLLISTHQSLQKTAAEMGASTEIPIHSLLSIPGLFDSKVESEDTKKIKEDLVLESVEEACQRLIEMRTNEGNELAIALLAGAKSIEELLEQIEIQAPIRVEESKVKLHDRIAELLGNEQFDKDRLELEVAILIDKLDVHEEFVRLRSHIKFYREAVQGSLPGGRKLNFLTQEMNREINTIGSKANNAQIQHLVVNMKEILEQIREQVQNIE